MTSSRIIYYYQTLIGLQCILEEAIPTCTHIILSAFHFGTNPDGSPYIHLNNYSPDDVRFTECWQQLQTLSERGVTILIMLGGAGGAYTELFSNYNTYYNMLKDTINKYDVISGIDLDIEEYVHINDIKRLMGDIRGDFGDKFIITMAPLGSSLQTDEIGMGGFIYKDLYNSPEGQYISWFNGQFYGSYTIDDVDRVVNNGYPSEKVVMGMISSQFSTFTTFTECLVTLIKIKQRYPDFGGVDVWEYLNSPPGITKNPSIWSESISNVFNSFDLKHNEQL
jgi:hypothetical protein